MPSLLLLTMLISANSLPKWMFYFLAEDVLLGLDFGKISDASNEPTENDPRCLVCSKINKQKIPCLVQFLSGSPAFPMNSKHPEELSWTYCVQPVAWACSQARSPVCLCWLWLKPHAGPGIRLKRWSTRAQTLSPHSRMSHVASCRHVGVWRASVKIQSLN